MHRDISIVSESRSRKLKCTTATLATLATLASSNKFVFDVGNVDRPAYGLLPVGPR